MSLNYQFTVDLAEKYRKPPGVLLDFGCGGADIAAMALERGFDAYGVDTYLGVGNSPENLAVAEKKIGPRVSTVFPGEPMPFEDGFFDIVVSNQVFEHVDDMFPVAKDIARVLRPGGILLALMPTLDVLWEDHLKMPLIHLFPGGSKTQRILMKGFRWMGLGSHGHVPADEWVNSAIIDLQTNIFHRSMKEYGRVFGEHFNLISEEEPAWARHRIENHPFLKHGIRIAKLPMFDGFLRLAVRKAAGAILVYERTHSLHCEESIGSPSLHQAG